MLHPKLHLARTGRALAGSKLVAPLQHRPDNDGVDVVRSAETNPELVPMRWGLIPGWWKKAKEVPSTFNARAETIGQKPCSVCRAVETMPELD
jgi:putative SOS response-associated peptidase YedK